MVEVIWSDNARKKFKEAIDYLKEYSIEAARSFRKKIDEMICNIESFPQIGRIVPELNISVYRELIVNDYRLIYRIIDAEGKAIILTIRHSRRLLDINSL